MRKRLAMASWYHPGLLVQTGIRVAISTVFGEMADRREAMAAANAVASQPFDDTFDYSGRSRDGAFWFDFLADTGDGWDPTYAIARLLTEGEIQPEGAAAPLPRGRILVIGGDLVYPTASRAAYDDRFLHPFEEALAQAPPEARRDMPDLYAIPGNHDWYDGLAAFFNLFCRRRIASPQSAGVDREGRRIAGRATHQTRSYFAIKLPGGWWLWGTDSQLKGYIDQPQIDFFQYVAANWMEDGSKLILCVGMPSWAYVDPAHPEREFSTFSYLERLAGAARRPFTAEERAAGAVGEDRPKGHQLKLVLTGDSHHYARYVEERAAEAHEAGDAPGGSGLEAVHYITCGGGGAFLHPTHQLADKCFAWDYPPPGVEGPRTDRGYARNFRIADKTGGGGEALFPDRATSAGLTKGNARFAFRHWGMTLVFFFGYLLYNWVLNFNARAEGYPSLIQAVNAGAWWQAPLRYVWTSFTSPAALLLFAVAMSGYYYFADAPDDGWKRFKIGVLGHGLVQAGAAILITSATLYAIGRFGFGSGPVSGIGATLAIGGSLVVASAVAALAAATIFGGYLWRQLNRHGRHWNEAFSSLAIEDYKSFLRLKIRPDGALEVHPVGMTGPPRDGSVAAAPNLHLIERPVVIGAPAAPARA
jgi:hypothetical protein